MDPSQATLGSTNGGYVTLQYHDIDPVLNKDIHVDTHQSIKFKHFKKSPRETLQKIFLKYRIF